MFYRNMAALSLGALLFTAVSANAQMPFFVEARGYANVFTGTINEWTFVNGTNAGTGRLGLLSYTLSGIAEHARDSGPINTPLSTVPATQSSDAVLTGSVTPGTIHFAANSEASEAPPYVIYKGQKYLNGGAEGTATGALSWGDTITIHSNTLPKGTPISVEFDLSLSGGLGILNDTRGGQDANSAVINTDLNVSLPGDNSIILSAGITTNKRTFGTMPTFPGGVYTMLKTARTDTPFQIDSSMEILAEADSYWDSPGVAAYVDASHTAYTSIKVLTPGLFTIQSASGNSYAPRASVPEPGLWAVLTSGCVAAFAIRRRRRNA